MTAERSDCQHHELKCWPNYFERILDGTKTFEVRKDDRGFKAGDALWLREWVPGGQGFTGRSIWKRVTFIYHADHNDLGMNMLSEGVCVMALAPLHSWIGHAHDAFVAADSGSYQREGE